MHYHTRSLVALHLAAAADALDRLACYLAVSYWRSVAPLAMEHALGHMRSATALIGAATGQARAEKEAA